MPTRNVKCHKNTHSTSKKPGILNLKSNLTIAALEITTCPDILPLKAVIALKIKIDFTIKNLRNRLIITGRL
jgi:hypothetical protein